MKKRSNTILKALGWSRHQSGLFDSVPIANESDTDFSPIPKRFPPPIHKKGYTFGLIDSDGNFDEGTTAAMSKNEKTI